MPIDIGNLGTVQDIFIGTEPVQFVRTESEIRYMRTLPNTPPVFAMGLGASAASANLGQSITFTANVTDPDVPPQTLDYVWSVDGTQVEVDDDSTNLTETYVHTEPATGNANVTRTISCVVTDAAGGMTAVETISRTWNAQSVGTGNATGLFTRPNDLGGGNCNLVCTTSILSLGRTYGTGNISNVRSSDGTAITSAWTFVNTSNISGGTNPSATLQLSNTGSNNWQFNLTTGGSAGTFANAGEIRGRFDRAGFVSVPIVVIRLG